MSQLGEIVPFVAPSPQFGAPEPARSAQNAAVSSGASHVMHHQDTDIPWTMQNSPEPSGSGNNVGIDAVEPFLQLLDTARYGGGIRISYPMSNTGIFRISYVPDKAEGQQTIFVDPGDGQILGDVSWKDYSPVAKAVEWGVMTHMGREYGSANQLINAVICGTIIFSVSFGLMMWWRHQPFNSLLGSPLSRQARLPRWMTVIITAICIIFPLVGATLALIFLARTAMRIQRTFRTYLTGHANGALK